MRVAVVGGGIAGLAAAHALRTGGADVTVYEAGDGVGGKIERTTMGGRPVDTGADSFLARRPEAVELCRTLGLADDLMAPATLEASVWARGRLRPLPAGLVLGVPSSIVALARSGILPPAAVVRAALEPLVPGRPLNGDAAIGQVVRDRFGRHVQERLVDPLIGGINAGRTEELSIEVAAPQLAEVANRERSLLRGLRRLRLVSPQAPEGPVFFSLLGGVGRLTDALAAGLDVRLRTAVESVGSVADLGADAVVLAVPAPQAAGLVAGVSTETAGLLRTIAYSSVVLTTMVFPARAFAAPPQGSGFLVPRSEGHLLTACTWASNKWPTWAEPGTVVVRVSAGRLGDERAMRMDDEQLVTDLLAELRAMTGVGGHPDHVHVRRWREAFPQAKPGHRALVARIRAALARDIPGVTVAGAWINGVGIPACIASGQAAAAGLLR